MTVEQLIEKLREFPPHRDVCSAYDRLIRDVREIQGEGEPVVVLR